MGPGDPVNLHYEYSRTRDPRLREAIVEMHVGLVRRLAGRFAHRGEELDDLVQVAFGGLLKAIDRFDPDRGVHFASFATPTIVGELKRHFRDHRWNIRVPRTVQENYLRVRETTEMLFHDLGHCPSPADIAGCTGLGMQDVLDALEAGSSFHPVSLNDVSHREQPLVERLFGRPCPELQSAEDRRQAASLLPRLPKREQRIVWLRCGHDLTQREIAAQLGISQMHVSRLLARSLETLRTLAADGARRTEEPPGTGRAA